MPRLNPLEDVQLQTVVFRPDMGLSHIDNIYFGKTVDQGFEG
jgi:hypothetical protein